MKFHVYMRVTLAAGLLFASARRDAAQTVQATPADHTTTPAATVPTRLQPGHSFTISFPDMPPTFAALLDKSKTSHKPPVMTVFLPRNYDPQRKHPLLMFLNGGDGGQGGDPGVARALSEEMDFVCVNVPLFKKDIKDFIVRDDDSRYSWPFYRTMLAKLEEVVPNIDPLHRVLGGFSNGAHMTQGLVDATDGEVARQFSAFFFVEGGGRMQRWDLLKGKPALIIYGTGAGRDVARFRERTQARCDAALAAGVKATTHEMPQTGHNFPASEYPAVRTWLREETTQVSQK